MPVVLVYADVKPTAKYVIALSKTFSSSLGWPPYPHPRTYHRILSTPWLQVLRAPRYAYMQEFQLPICSPPILFISTSYGCSF